MPLYTCVTQASGDGPQIYNNYTAPLGAILLMLSVIYHLFADDSQIYKPLNPNSTVNQFNARDILENAIRVVGKWLETNKLKLNETKSEFIIFGSKQQLKKMKYDTIKVGDATITSKSCVRNLGAMFDCEPKMRQHVSHVIKTSYFHLRQIKMIRKYLTVDAAKVIITRIDYCNALL